MNVLKYDELCAEEAEKRLGHFESAKKKMREMFFATYNKLLVDPDSNYTIKQTWESIEQAIDDFTHLDRAILEKTILDYETASQRRHEREESTLYA